MTYDDPICPFEEALADKSAYTKPREQVLAEIAHREEIIRELLEEME